MIPILNKISASAFGIDDLYPGLAGSIKAFLWKMLIGNTEDYSTGPAYYINSNGEIVTVPAESPLYAFAKFWSMGSWDQMCTYPYDPSQWENTCDVSIGNIIGDFTETIFTDNGNILHRGQFYSSVLDGNPTGGQSFCILYNKGSSGIGRITFRDLTLALESYIDYDGTLWTIAGSSAGVPTVDGYGDHSAGFSYILFSIMWNNPSNTLKVGIGPKSSNESNIIVFACLYANELGHIWPFTGPGDTTIASRAGTINAPTVVGDKLYELLDGKADGTEIIVSNDESWTTTNSTVSDGVITFTINSNYGTAYQPASSEFISGEMYEVKLRVVSNTGVDIFLSASGFSDSKTLGALTAGVYIYRVLCTIDNGKIFFTVGNQTGLVVIDSISIKKVSSASFKLKFNWTPSFSYSDLPVSTTVCLLYGGTQNLLQFRTDGSGNGYIDLMDGTNTISVALDWEAFTSYSFTISCGDNNPTYPGVDKMQLIVDSTASTVSDFDGSFDPDTAIVFGESTDYPQNITPLVFDNVLPGDWE